MIDTDKYEGHTEGPWTLYSTASGGPTIAGKLNDVDWQLIADAPLLLAEVKRLKERADFMEWQLAKTAGALAYEWRETFDELGDKEFYLWLIETFGTDEDKENAGIEDEEEEE